MKKFATIAALALAAQQANAACSATLNTFQTNIGGVTTTATQLATKTSTACASIVVGTTESCCTNAVLDSFKTNAEALVTSLSTKVGERDQQIIDARGAVLEVNETLIKIVALLAANPSATLPTYITEFLTAYETTITNFVTKLATYKTNFPLMQKARQTCMDTMIKAQVATWCLACYDDAGAAVASDKLVVDAAFTTTLATACADYVTYSTEQSDILKLYYIRDLFASFLSAAEKLVGGDSATSTTEFKAFAEAFNKITYGTDETDWVVSSTCTTGSCSFITAATDSFLPDTGKLDQENLIGGGVTVSAPTDLTVARRLEEELPAGRRLAFNPDLATEVGFTITAFPQNPGSVDNEQNSAVRNGVVACAITALVALF